MRASGKHLKKLRQGVFLGLVGAGIAFTLWQLGWLDTWEAKTWDWRASVLAAPGPATDKIVLILLDQDSLDWGKDVNGWSWPWPREVYSAIIAFCKRAGVKALAFDVIYSEDSPYGVYDDAALAEAMADMGTFTAAVFLGQKTGSNTRWPEDVPTPGLIVQGAEDPAAAAHIKEISFLRATFPIPPIARSAAMLSNVHANPDPDGIYRRVKLFGRFDNKVLPCLGLGTYLAGHPKTTLTFGPDTLQVGGKTIPLDPGFNTILRYRGPSGTHQAYSAAAVLQSEIRMREGQTPTITDIEVFKDKYVLFGFSAPGLFDLRSAPVGGVYPGVEIQATLLDNFLSNDFMQSVPPLWTAAVTLALALACAALMLFFAGPWQSTGIGLIFTGLPLILAFGSYKAGFWLPLAVLETAVLSSLVVAVVFNYATEGRQKRFIKGAFRQYLSPAVIDQLIQHPERLKLGGERRVLTIFFSDLQGFTSISEGLSPEELTSLLNDYLTAMTEIIQTRGGTVDKYEGDAIIAFWNAPLELPDHARQGLQATLECQAELARMRPEIKQRIGKSLLMRIGLNTGPAVVGNLGSHTRFDYTMLGDAVNLAARLEGANKAFGNYTLISDATRRMAGENFHYRQLAKLVVMGRSEPVTVFEPMFLAEYEKRKAILDVFTKGLDAFYAGAFDQALDSFSQIEAKDPPAAAYVRKCRELLQAPPAQWQGVWVMKTK